MAGGFALGRGGGGLAARFSRRGVVVRAGGVAWSLGLRGVGRGGRLVSAPAVLPAGYGNQVRYQRRGVSEWYANGPLGLEQGFTLASRPAGAAGAPLTLALGELPAGVRVSVSRDHRSVGLMRGGLVVVRYRGLFASDARGLALPARIVLAGRALSLRIDDRFAAYPVRVDPFVQAAKLTASDGGSGDILGTSVAVSGDTIVVGAPQAAVSGNAHAGAAYVFVKPANGWGSAPPAQAKLTASDGVGGDQFGNSVAISGDTIVVGAWDAPGGQSRGAAYVFVKPANGWGSAPPTEAKLTASDAANSNFFGSSVAVSGGTIVVGALGATAGGGADQGAAYVFVEPPGGWAPRHETAKLTAFDGASDDHLGLAVGVSGDTVTAGAPNGGGSNQGAAYVFVRPPNGWGSGLPTQAKLTARDGAFGDLLGYSVGVSGDAVVAGAPGAAVSGNGGQGAAYVFVKPANGWATGTETAKLTASDGGQSDQFAKSVAIAGDEIVSGALANGSHGAAYGFAKPPGGWGSAPPAQDKLTASDGAPGDEFGDSVAVDAGTVVSGAPSATISGNPDQGAAYVFTSVAGGGPPAPAVVTGQATNVSSDGATLNGTVNPNGSQVTDCHFEYGPTAQYGSRVACSQDPGAGTSPVAVSATLSGLGSAKTWNYRLVATGPGGTSTGDNQTLTTLSAPASTSLMTSQTWRTSPGPAAQGPSITVPSDATGETDRATITGNNTFMAGGTVTFGLYSSPQCTQDSQVFTSTNGTSRGFTPFAEADSDPVNTRLPVGTYYWTAAYSGDSRNQPSTSPCGAETLTVSARGGGGFPVASFTPPRVVRAGAVTTLNASASQNAVRYEWDLNGDGTPDVSCRTPQLQTQFLPVSAQRSGDRVTAHAALVARVGLTVVSATGQTSSVTQNVSLANASATLAPAAASVYRNTQDALCMGAGVVSRTVCLVGPTETFGVIEAQGCDLHRVTGTKDLPAPEDRALIQSAIDQYNSTPGFATYGNVLCESALINGAVSNCRISQQLDRRDVTGLLDSGSIELYECRGPIYINGLEFLPASGHPLVISPQLNAIFWSHTEIDLNDKALPLPSSGRFDFHDVNAPLTALGPINDRQSPPLAVDMNVPRGALPGLIGLTPQTATLSFERNGESRFTRIDTSLALPSPLSSAFDSGPPTFRSTFTQSNETDLQIGHIHATAPDIDFGPIGIDNVGVDYDSADPKPLRITGAINFLGTKVDFAPQLPYHPNNGILFYGRQFQHAGATVDFSCPLTCPPDLFPGVSLNSVDFEISRNPWVLGGGAELGVVDLVTVHGGIDIAFASDDDPWTLDRGQRPELPDFFAPQTFTTLTVAAAGNATVNLPIIGDEPLAHGYVVYAAPGYVSFGGSVTWSLLGIVSFDGGLTGEFNAVNKRFNFTGHLQTCVVDVICAGAFGVVSDAGAGACFEVGPVSVGGGVQFPSHVYLWPFDGCKWSRFTEDHVFDGARDVRARGPRADVRPYVVQIARGDPSRAISIAGDGEAPAVRVSGPGGQDVTSSTGDCTPATDTTYNGSTCLTVVGHVRIMRSPSSHQTVVGLQDPAPGSYTITPMTPSAGFAKVFTADDPASPRITGSVRDSGASRILRYNVRQIPDEKVTFLDVGPQGAREIGTANGGTTGALTFTPAPGNASHLIEAEVEMAGLPVPMLAGGSSGALDARGVRAASRGGSMLTIARFRPPRLVHAGAARALRVQRHGTVLRLSWRKARGAIRYAVVLRLGNGLLRTVTVSGSSARIAGVPRTEAGQITVRAIGNDGRLGPALRGRFRPTATPHTILRRLA